MVLGCKTQYTLNPGSFLPPMTPKIIIKNQTEPTQIDIQLCPSRNIPNYPLGWIRVNIVRLSDNLYYNSSKNF